ncbi:MAG: PcfJ domain-containing protein [Clostridia bacterium]|nr:PcfJ domain-containing protein [Clostridia bacterium]
MAKSPAELVAEGKALNHCVGRGHYESKMANGQSLIFFVRKANALDNRNDFSIFAVGVNSCHNLLLFA